MRQPISSANSSKSIRSENHSNNKTTPCCIKVGIKRGPWTPEEDEKLSNYIDKEGEGRWRTLPKKAGLSRCGKSCRLRWMNYLRPSVKRGHIAPDEEDLILRLHRLLGNRSVHNLSKKLISQGIDPRTHKPLEPNISPSNNKPSSSKPNNHSQNFNTKFTTGDHIIVPSLFNENHGGYFHEGTNVNNDEGLHLESSEGIENEGNNEDDDINCCTDDVFSSFLNSLK